jgi:hypothetical protein
MGEINPFRAMGEINPSLEWALSWDTTTIMTEDAEPNYEYRNGIPMYTVSARLFALLSAIDIAPFYHIGYEASLLMTSAYYDALYKGHESSFNEGDNVAVTDNDDKIVYAGEGDDDDEDGQAPKWVRDLIRLESDISFDLRQHHLVQYRALCGPGLNKALIASYKRHPWIHPYMRFYIKETGERTGIDITTKVRFVSFYLAGGYVSTRGSFK